MMEPTDNNFGVAAFGISPERVNAINDDMIDKMTFTYLQDTDKISVEDDKYGVRGMRHNDQIYNVLVRIPYGADRAEETYAAYVFGSLLAKFKVESEANKKMREMMYDMVQSMITEK